VCVCVCLVFLVHTYLRQLLHFLDSDLFMVSSEEKDERGGDFIARS
jgi:hypothetical protein